VIVTREIIVAVSACANPSDFAKFFSNCEHAGVNCLTVDCLFFVASNRVHVSKSHELLKWSMHEDEVSISVVMRIKMLLLLKPADRLNRET